MRAIRRWLFAAALAGVSAWLYVVVGSGAQVLAVLDGVRASAAVARAAADEAPLAAPALGAVAAENPPPPLPAQLTRNELAQSPATDTLDDEQIMRLLEDEIALDTDPAAADELLRAFGESLDTGASKP